MSDTCAPPEFRRRRALFSIRFSLSSLCWTFDLAAMDPQAGKSGDQPAAERGECGN